MTQIAPLRPESSPGAVHTSPTAPGHISHGARDRGCSEEQGGIAGARAFAGAGWTYWTEVFPLVCGELGRRHRHALAIPDPQLRDDALQALAKRSNVEGAAAFATFAPARHRAAAVRASAAFQAAYDYLDVLAERLNPEAVRNAMTLNGALLAALSLRAPEPRPTSPRASGALDLLSPSAAFYAHHGKDQDGGYLAAMIAACRQALGELPSYATAEAGVLRAAERAAGFQGFNCGALQGDHDALADWARQLTPPDSSLAWWETAAAAGSSLGVHALIAAAASPRLREPHAAAIEDAYFPWIGALHSLLDQLVDVEQDTRTGQANIAGCYRDPRETARSLARLATRARGSAAALDRQERSPLHSLLLSAMAANYLSMPEASHTHARPARRAVLTELGPLAGAAIAVFRISRLARGG